jgi:hypothetical protein
MKSFDPNTFWNFISSFFSFLDNKSKTLIENFWDGLNTSAGDMTDRANDFVNAQAPENASTDVTEAYYEIPVSPLISLPIKLDPTDNNSQQMITPKSIIIVEPSYNEQTPVYGDMIEIVAQDYYTLRNIAIGNYAVIVPKDPNIPTKYFKIDTLKSSEEDPDGNRYYPPTGLNII